MSDAALSPAPAFAPGAAEPPQISVIVPVRNDPVHLEACLRALARTEYPQYEVIVVDDGSTDHSGDLALRFGARLLRLDQNVGPAAARNRGVEIARGQYVAFIDADVCVSPRTVGQFMETFEADPAADAVFGSYDTTPGELNILSQYRNLLHHHVHQEASRDASTFWSGCGAVRRSVFLQHGGFNSRYGRPCIEDIELGVRMRAAGHKIVLERHIQVTHLKRWTFWGMVKTDLFDRAIPWTQLILREKTLPNDLNLKTSQRASAVLSLGLILTLAAGIYFLPWLALLPLAALVGILTLDRWSIDRRIPTLLRAAAVLAVLAGAGWLTARFGAWMLLPAALLAGVVLLNLRLFAFFARVKAPLFAALVLPLHIFYFLYSASAFASCVICHKLQQAARAVGLRSRSER